MWRSLGILHTAVRGRRVVPVDVSTDGRTEERNCVPLVILRDVVFYANLNHILEKWLGVPPLWLALRHRRRNVVFDVFYRVISERKSARDSLVVSAERGWFRGFDPFAAVWLYMGSSRILVEWVDAVVVAVARDRERNSTARSWSLSPPLPLLFSLSVLTRSHCSSERTIVPVSARDGFF